MASTLKTWLLVALGIPSLILALLAGAAYVFATSDWGHDWLRQRLVAEVQQATGARLEVESLDGNLLWRMEAQGLRLVRGGQEMLSARRLEVTYNLLAIIGGALRIGRLKVDGLRLDLARLPTLGSGGGGPPVTIRRLVLSELELKAGGRLGPLERLAGVSLRGRLDWEPGGGSFKGHLQAKRIELTGLSQPVALAGDLRWQGDTLHLPRLDLTLGTNHAVARGTLRWGRKPSLELHLAAQKIDAAALPLAWPGPRLPEQPFAVKAQAAGNLKRLKATVVVLGSAGRLRLSGALDFKAMTWRATAVLKRVDLAAWGLATQPVRLSGEARLSGVGLPPAAGSRAQVELSFPRVTAAGQDFTRVRGSALWRGAQIQLKRFSAEGLGGSLEAQGRLALADDPTLQLRLGFNGLKPPPAWSGPLSGGVLTGSLEASGPLSRLAAKLNLRDSVITPGVGLDSLDAELVLAGGRPVLKSLTLRNDFLQATVQGRADLQSADIKATLTMADLARLGQALAALGLPVNAPLRGSAQVRLGLRGPWDALALQLKGRIDNLAAPEVFARRVELSARLTRLGPRPQGRARILAHGLKALAENWPEVDLEADAGAEALRCRVAAQGLVRQLSLDLHLDQWWQWPLQGTIHNLVYHHSDRGQWRQKGRAQFSLYPGGGRLAGFALTLGQQEVAVDAQYHSGGRVSGLARMSRVKIAAFLPADTGLPPAALVTGQAQLGGTLAAPRLKVSGEMSGLKVRGLPNSRARLSGQYAAGWLSLQGDIRTGEITTLAFNGRLGMNLRLLPPWLPGGFGSLDFSLRGRDMPLALFQPLATGVTGLKGRLNVDLTVAGTLEQPRVTGDIKLSQGSFTLAATGQRFRGVTAHLRANGRELVVRELSTAKAGQLWLKGKVILPGDGPGKLALRCRAQGLQVSFGALGGATADADIALTGTFGQPRLTGVVTPRQVSLRLGLGTPEAMDDVVVLGPGQKPPPVKRQPAIVQPPAMLAPLKMVVVVSVDRVLRVKVSQGWLDVTGRIVIRKEPGGPLTYHRGLKILKGLILYQARDFVVTGGSVDFAGKKELDPVLKEVRAELNMGKTQVQLVAQGPASDLHIQFTSQPPMSQADILSTIVFGQPAATLSQQQYDKLSAQALALLGMKGRQELERLVGRKLAPDVVTVGRSYDAGSFIEAGKYLSDNLYLRYRKSTQQDGGQNVGLEYRINRFFSIESQVGTTRDSGVDLTINFDF